MIIDTYTKKRGIDISHTIVLIITKIRLQIDYTCKTKTAADHPADHPGRRLADLR